MQLSDWLMIVLICGLGAMSPGPSLALIVRHALSGGRTNGFVAATSHALAVGLYALLSALGLVLVLMKIHWAGQLLQGLGAVFLLWLATRLLRAPIDLSSFSGQANPIAAGVGAAARDGFLIAFLNPKIMLFFAAVFSPFIRPEALLAEKLGMAAIAFGMDWVWYLLVAALVSHRPVMQFLQQRGWWLDKVFGVLLLAFSVSLMVTLF